MIRRPTTKAAIVASVGALLLIVGTTAQAGWLFVLAAGVLGLAASGILTRHRLGGAEITRVVPARAQVGETVAAAVVIANRSGRRLPVMRIEDRFPAFEDLVAACDTLPAGATATADLKRVAVRRGVFDAGETALSTGAPFGLLRTRTRVEVASRIIVHPYLTDVDGFPLPDTPARTADEALAVARAGSGEVFAGVRDYRPGDQRRWIHWRTTARTGRLAVREHEEPAQSPVVLVVAALETDDSADLAANIAASVGLYALGRGRPVHCIGRGALGEHVENASRLEVLDWAAALGPSPSTHEEYVTAAFRRWGRRCSFVLFHDRTGVANEAALLAQRHGAGVQIVRSLPPEESRP